VITDYSAALDLIYESYIRTKAGVAGKLDRDVRQPERIVEMARRLDLLPPKHRTIVVAGSKGKGTVSRAVAKIVQATTGEKVGMLISPEETAHFDRMRIDSVPADEQIFMHQFRALEVEIAREAARLPEGQYLSPSGLFFLIALRWFHEMRVRHFVLEAGRGAQFDEVGTIPAAVGVVTSILPEHLDYLGPTLDDVARNKLHLRENCAALCAGPTARPWVRPGDGISLVEEVGAASADGPRWLLQDRLIAQTAAKIYLGREIPQEDLGNYLSVNPQSFGHFATDGVECVYEAVVQPQSLDREFVARVARGKKMLACLSIPDDKDAAAMDASFSEFADEILHIAMEGTRGYLSYKRTEQLFSGKQMERVDYRDVSRFACIVTAAIRETLPSVIYFAGTHTFIRLVRSLMAQAPRRDVPGPKERKP
jgi:folylpolyglutamate synthase/dihydropteroate synthase